MNETTPVLEFRDIDKRFPGVHAIDHVSLAIEPGEIHAIVGENGAGKSTLMKIAAGVYVPDSGDIRLRGETVLLTSTTTALRLGISMVPQELNLVPRMSIGENIMLGIEPVRTGGVVDDGALHRRARELLSDLNADLDTRLPLGGLSVALQQVVQIARAFAYEASVLIMDEPTASLGEKDAETLFDRIRTFRARGTTVIYISHRMEEVLSLADRISVLRDGNLVATLDRGDANAKVLVELMIGRSLREYLSDRRARDKSTQEVLEVQHITVERSFRDVSFVLHKGEILGFAGLVGAGRTEVAGAILGVTPPDSGEILLRGKSVQIRSPGDALAMGIGCVPEERKRQGLFLNLDVLQNVSMPFLARLIRFMSIDRTREREEVADLVKRLGVATPSLDHPVSDLSGGNQQKVVVARWLGADVDILILDEPTRGIDVNAKAEIHRLIGQLADEGKSIILISSELDELVALADSIVVMREGSVVGSLTAERADKAAILHLAMWGANGDAVPSTGRAQ